MIPYHRDGKVAVEAAAATKGDVEVGSTGRAGPTAGKMMSIASIEEPVGVNLKKIQLYFPQLTVLFPLQGRTGCPPVSGNASE